MFSFVYPLYHLFSLFFLALSIYLMKAEIRQNLERKEVVKKTITNDGKETKKIQSKSTKVGRNDLCPCGSGKKYKACCGRNQ